MTFTCSVSLFEGSALSQRPCWGLSSCMVLVPVGLFFVFQTWLPELGASQVKSEPWVGAMGPASGGILPRRGHQPWGANPWLFALRPRTVFSLCSQPINTESAPKNVANTVSDGRCGGWQGTSRASMGSPEGRRVIWGKVNT